MSNNNVYAFVIQNKKGENMLAIPNNVFRIDKALYLADRIYDKHFQFCEGIIEFITRFNTTLKTYNSVSQIFCKNKKESNQKVDRHFVIDHDIAGIIYITDQHMFFMNDRQINPFFYNQFIFQLFISSAHIAVGYDLIKKLVNAFNASKIQDPQSMEKKIFEVYFMLHQSMYQKFIDHKFFNVNYKNQYIKNAIEDKVCDKDLIKTRFASMQQQQIGSTLSSKIFEERDAIPIIPYKYAKKNFNNTKTNQFLQSFNDKIEIPNAVFKQNNYDSKREAYRNKLYSLVFQMKIKSACSQSDSTRLSYPLNKNNLKFIDKLKPKIQSFSSQQMQMLKQKYGNKINHQIIQQNIENQFNDLQIIQNGKTIKNDNGHPNDKSNQNSNNVSQSKDKNQLNSDQKYNENNNVNIINSKQNRENGLSPKNQVQQEQTKTLVQQQINQQPQQQQQSNKHQDLLDFDFNDQLNDNENKEDIFNHNNQQIQFFSNQQNNFFKTQQQQQQQQEIDLI